MQGFDDSHDRFDDDDPILVTPLRETDRIKADPGTTLNDDNEVIGTTKAATSHVNGQGLWRSWQRSFRSPLDALRDCVDNAIDANRGDGKIRIFGTGNDTKAVRPGGDPVEGLLLMNSFPEESYKEMHKVLEVFCSNKEQDAIGENGVGIKQASAALSDFNVVLTRKGMRFQVGFLAASLQKEEGVVIPSYTFDEGSNWKEEIQLLAETDHLFRECMLFLGGKLCQFMPEDEVSLDKDTELKFLDNGINRLERYMVEMIRTDEGSEGWGKFSCVFTLLQDQLRIGQNTTTLLAQLRMTLPKTYIHLTSDTCNILIGNNPLKFQHWERRLVELTCFNLKVSSTVSYKLDGEVVNPHGDMHNMRAYIGFDAERCSTEGNNELSLYIYSRECGRLIKHVADARTELSLMSGGTDYCQGLTLILDDFESSLPLTPTKQDIAYSDGKNGVVHEENIKAWLRAIVSTYYQYYLPWFGTHKMYLTSAVQKHSDQCRGMIPSEDLFIPIQKFHLFNSFSGISWRLLKDRITVKSRKDIHVNHGEGTLMTFVLPGNNANPALTSARATSQSCARHETQKRISYKEDAPGQRQKRRRSSASRNDASASTEMEVAPPNRRPTKDQVWDELSCSWLPVGTGHRPPPGRRRLGMVWDARNGYWVPDPDESGKVSTKKLSSSTNSQGRKSLSSVQTGRRSDSDSEKKSALASKDAEITKLKEELKAEKASRSKLSRRCEGLLDNMDKLRQKALTQESEATRIKTQCRQEIESLRHRVAIQEAEIKGLHEELEQKTRQLLAYDEDSDNE